MNTLTYISYAAWAWAAVHLALLVVAIRLGRWTLAPLSALMLCFFVRYGINTYGAAGHDVSIFGWANNLPLILVQIVVGVILTTGVVVELIIVSWPRRAAKPSGG